MAVVSCLDDESDYGISAEEESLLSQLLSDLPTPPTGEKLPLAESVALASRVAAASGGHDTTEETNVSNPVNDGDQASAVSPVFLPEPGTLSTELPRLDEIACYPNLGRKIPSLERADEAAAGEAEEDKRSPLLRFRTFPKKPFSVSDLTASSWCELQYWYILTRLPFGRRTQTVAMKEGTKIHKDLEDEVHTTVRVEIATREDAFGLRVWNLIQGLRTLRETGLTRELEVWGLVDGNLVNGIIDGLSYASPEVEKQPDASSTAQPSITDFFPSSAPTPKGPLVYLTDVKTRGTLKPANTAQLRPAMVQLFLYHRMLSDMAAHKLDFFRVFRRYNLDPDDFFSDEFLAQMASMHDAEFFGGESPTDSRSPSSSPDLIKYRSLRELIPLVESEIRQTFPDGASSIAPLLSVEYRFRRDGSLIDNRTFPMDDEALDAYLTGSLQWWKGKREPRGVQIEDAWKCMVCEFAEDCTWRKGLDEARLTSVRRRLQTKRSGSGSPS